MEWLQGLLVATGWACEATPNGLGLIIQALLTTEVGLCSEFMRGGEVVSRLAHTQKVGGSNPSLSQPT